MGNSASNGDGKKDRLKRLGFLTLPIAAVILTALSIIYPKVELVTMAKFTVVLAIVVAVIIDVLYERSKK